MPSARHALAVIIVAGGLCSLCCTSLSAAPPIDVSPVTTQPAPLETSNWPLFRGNAEGQGVAQTSLPDKPQLLWKFKPGNTTFDATAVIVGDTVYVGDGDRAFHALALADGKPRWSTPIDQGFVSAAAVRDGRVYVGDAGGVFHCFDSASGRELWRFATAGEINSSPNLFEDSVIFGSQDGSLYRLRGKTGELIWKYSIQADGGIQSSPTLSGGRVLFAGCDGSLHVLDVATGKKISSLSFLDMTLATAAISGPTAFFGTEGGVFLGVNWQESKVLWKYQNPRSDAGYRSSAAVSADWVIIGGRSKAVQRLKPVDGEVVWSFSTAGRVDSSPVVAGERVYFGSADGRVYGLALDTGRPVWKHDTGGGVKASPALAQRRLIIGNENGVLYCFGVK